MTLIELVAMKNAGKWGWVFAPEGIEDKWDCVIKGCPLPCIFEFFPEGFSNWYSVCAWHGKAIGMHAYYDESTLGHSHGG